MWIFLFFILCILLWVKTFISNNDYWKKRNIVQVNGVIWNLIVSKRSLSEVYKEIYDDHPTEHSIGVFQGHRPALLMKDLRNIQTVLAGDFPSFYSRGIIVNKKDLLADNLLFMDDYLRWKLVRQKVTPVFTSARLKNMFYIMERCARDFVTSIEKNDNFMMMKDPFDILYDYTTAALGASVFGIDTQTNNTMDSPFLDMARKAIAPTLKANLKFIIASTFTSIIDFFNMKLFGDYEDFFIGVVRRALREREFDTDKRNDFIDMCLELQNQKILHDVSHSYELTPTVEFLAAQAFFFFVAGTDTSTNALHFTLLEISNHPEILRKLHLEIDEVFHNCKENVKFEDIEKLKYLDMVISEALRKYPPIGVIQRKCTKDTILPSGNVQIKKNELVLIPVYAIHRDVKYYSDPEKFDPERFSPQNLTNQVKYSYLPFGEGQRICIGARYARLQLKVGIAWLLRRFSLRHQSRTPERFEPSVFAVRAPDIGYEIFRRDSQTN